jgi:hypothetical protein
MLGTVKFVAMFGMLFIPWVRLTAAEPENPDGTWQMVIQFREGQPVVESEYKGLLMTIKEGGFLAKSGGEIVYEGTYKLDSVVEGRRQSIVKFSNGRFAGEHRKQTAWIDGDTLITCLVPAGRDWSTEFASTKANGCWLSVFKRQRTK